MSHGSPPGLEYQVAGGVARITINNPGRRNALTPAMWRELAELARRANQEGRVLVIRGAGGVFTAGADLAAMASLPVDQVEAIFRQMEATLQAVENLTIPTVAEIAGFALGAGFLLALACDIRYAARGSRLGIPIARLGITVTPAFARRIVKAAGPDRARELLITGRLVRAQEAARMGLVHQVMDAADLPRYTDDLLARLAGYSPASLRAAKEAVALAAAGQDDPTRWHIDPVDFPEGVRAFLEKRPPRFQGL